MPRIAAVALVVLLTSGAALAQETTGALSVGVLSQQRNRARWRSGRADPHVWTS